MKAPEICPVCGADVPHIARACPECGADERSGWSENAALDGKAIHLAHLGGCEDLQG